MGGIQCVSLPPLSPLFPLSPFPLSSLFPLPPSSPLPVSGRRAEPTYLECRERKARTELIRRSGCSPQLIPNLAASDSLALATARSSCVRSIGGKNGNKKWPSERFGITLFPPSDARAHTRTVEERAAEGSVRGIRQTEM